MSFADINKLVRKKEIIVHINPENLDKVLMIIKPDTDRKGSDFYHIEVEELWNSEKALDSFVITNYVHAQYYPDKKIFNHIDFSVNQYSKETYEKKYKDAVTDTAVPIDKYGDEHYKIWCVESDNIKWKLGVNLFALLLMNHSGIYFLRCLKVSVKKSTPSIYNHGMR